MLFRMVCRQTGSDAPVAVNFRFGGHLGTTRLFSHRGLCERAMLLIPLAAKSVKDLPDGMGQTGQTAEPSANR